MSSADAFARRDWRNVVVSSAGPALACIWTNPFDVARVRLQMQGEGVRGGATVYGGVADVIARNWRSDGVRGVQRGLGVAMLRESVGAASCAAAPRVVSTWRKLLTHAPQPQTKCSVRIGLYEPLFSALESLAVPGARVLAAACTGATSAVVFSPLDLLKSRVFAAGSHGTPSHHASAESGALAAAKAAVNAGGGGIWVGVSFNVFRSVCWATVQLPLFFALEPRFCSFFPRESYAGTLLAASLSAGAATLAIQPADVLRTRAYNASNEVTRAYLKRGGGGGGGVEGGVLFHARFASGLVAAEGTFRAK